MHSGVVRPRSAVSALCVAAIVFLTVGSAFAQQATAPAQQAPSPADTHVSCTSKPGERNHCAAATAAGVALARSSGDAPCLLGKTWGYDDTGIWVADGCSGEFITGAAAQQEEQTKEKTPEYIPNLGFLLYDGEKGQI